MARFADTIFINSRLWSPDALPEGADGLAVIDGQIAAVGDSSHIRTWANAPTEVVDLAGRTLMPGFIDAHTHLVTAGLQASGLHLDLSDTGSLDEVLDRVQEAARSRESGQWIRGRGWDESQWTDGHYLTREDLDGVAPGHPVALSRVDGHLLVINSRALEAIDVGADSSVVDAARGLLREEAAWAMLDQIPLTDEDIETAIRAGVEKAHSLGITSVHDVVDGDRIRGYHRLHRQGTLDLRVRLNPLVQHLHELEAIGLGSEFGDDRLQLGAIKLFTDGSIGARNAALFSPYADDASTSGELNYDQPELNRLVDRAHDAGFQVMLHAIGDRAIDAALSAIESANVEPSDRARIEHLEMPTDEQLQRMAERGVIASMQPNFLQWSGPNGMYVQRLGAERDARIDPHRRVLDAGAPLAFGSDTMPIGPLYGVSLAANAPHEEQRLRPDDALQAYTSGAAYVGFVERRCGTLQPGACADLVALNDDPTSVEPERFPTLQVESTYVAGRLVHSAAT